jgi:hypothetical protein
MIQPTYGQIARAQSLNAWDWFAGLIPASVEERGTRYDLGRDIADCLEKIKSVVEKLRKDFEPAPDATPEQIQTARESLVTGVREFEALKIDPIEWEPIPDSQLGYGPLPPAALGALIECGIVKPRSRK